MAGEPARARPPLREEDGAGERGATGAWKGASVWRTREAFVARKEEQTLLDPGLVREGEGARTERG